MVEVVKRIIRNLNTISEIDVKSMEIKTPIKPNKILYANKFENLDTKKKFIEKYKQKLRIKPVKQLGQLLKKVSDSDSLLGEFSQNLKTR